MTEDFENFVRRVKDATAIEDVIEETGHEWRLQRKASNYIHGIEHSSLVVRVDEQYYVWNDTSEKGDVFTWLEARRKWDFWTSLQWLAERAKLEVPKFVGTSDGQAINKRQGSARGREDAFGVAQRLFAKWLWADTAALEYVKGRGWTDETIREAGIGFSGRATPAELTEMRGELNMHEVNPEGPLGVAIMGWKGNVKAWGKTWGIEVSQSWLEWGAIPGMMGRIRLVYSHYERGRVVYMTGRNILGAEQYPDGREVKSFNLAASLAGNRRLYMNHCYGRRAEECVIVEGQADGITLGQWGIAAVAICGNQWEDHLEELGELTKRHGTVYVGLDMDEAGQKALVGRERDWPLAKALGPMARIINWDKGGWNDIQS